MYNEVIANLRSEMLDLNEQVQAIQAAADAEDRDLTDEEQQTVDGLFAKFEGIEADIKRRERIEAQTRLLTEPVGRRTDPEDPMPQQRPEREPHAQAYRGAQPTRVSIPDDAGKRGFRSFGEFALKVRNAAANMGRVDPRLVLDANGANESVGADGGFLVPPDFRQAIWQKVMGEESLVSRCDDMETSSNSVVFPKDEDEPWNTAGIRVYRVGEGAQLTKTKPVYKEQRITLPKLTALVPVTEELREDAALVESHIFGKVPEVMNAALNSEIISGTGTGQMLGINNATCTISVAKQGSQVADTVVAQNILDMWARMYASCRQRSVWLINQDIEPQLYGMSLPGKSNTGAAVTGWGSQLYIPPGGLSATPYGTLMGRPVLPIQACETLGDKGDIILADLSQYAVVSKAGGIRQDVSMHLYFDYDELAYRFILRIGGQPWWSAAITPENSSNTLSCFVNLAERA